MISDFPAGSEKRNAETPTGTEPSRRDAPLAVTDRFFGMLGMCRRAGKTVLGTELICSQMRGRRKPSLVVISSGASDNTREKLIAKSSYYGVPYLLVDLDPGSLARRLGKTGVTAAVAVTDPALAREIENACKGRESSNDEDGSHGNRG